MPVPEDKVQHEQVEKQGRTVSGDYGNVFLKDAVDQPQGKSSDKDQVHANGNILDFFGLPGFPYLRGDRCSGTRARYQAQEHCPAQQQAPTISPPFTWMICPVM